MAGRHEFHVLIDSLFPLSHMEAICIYGTIGESWSLWNLQFFFSVLEAELVSHMVGSKYSYYWAIAPALLCFGLWLSLLWLALNLISCSTFRDYKLAPLGKAPSFTMGLAHYNWPKRKTLSFYWLGNKPAFSLGKKIVSPSSKDACQHPWKDYIEQRYPQIRITQLEITSQQRKLVWL